MLNSILILKMSITFGRNSYGINMCSISIDLVSIGTCVATGYIAYRLNRLRKKEKLEYGKDEKLEYGVKPRKILDVYSANTDICMTPEEFQAYSERFISRFEPCLILNAIDLKPGNFGMLLPAQMTGSIMCRAFELDVENIIHLSKKGPVTEYNDKIFIKEALDHAVMVHGLEKVSNVIKRTELNVDVTVIWDTIVHKYVKDAICNIRDSRFNIEYYSPSFSKQDSDKIYAEWMLKNYIRMVGFKKVFDVVERIELNNDIKEIWETVTRRYIPSKEGTVE